MRLLWVTAFLFLTVMTAASAQAPLPSTLPPVNRPGCSPTTPQNCTNWTAAQWQIFMDYVVTKADANNGSLTNPTITNPLFTGVVAFPAGITQGGQSFGSTAFTSTGTAGHTVPFLDGINTWSDVQTLSKSLKIPGWSNDVRAFGAVCDGTTSDSSAFQNAINNLGGSGGRVAVPATSLGCYLASGVSISNASLSGTILEGVAGTYFPGFADNVKGDWTQRGSWIICGDLVNACITQSGNGSIIRNLNFWYNQPTPPSVATCSSPCTMTHNWAPTTYPYTILISSPQNFNAVENVTIVNATNCIDVEGPSNGVGSFFTYFEHLNLGCFNNPGMRLHRVDNPVELHDVNFNILWNQASSDVLGYTEGDATHVGHKVDLSLEYASNVHLSDVKFVQSKTAIYTANATVTNGLGPLTFGAQGLTGEGVYFIQTCQAMAVENSTTVLQGRFTDVSNNTDPQTSTSTQCGGYLPNAFDLASDNVEFGITNLDGLYANTVGRIGGGTSGILHIKGASHTTNYSAFNNSLPAFTVNSGASLDIDNINEYFSTNVNAGPHISGDPNWPQTFARATATEGPTLTKRQHCFQLSKTTAAFSTNQWCLVDDDTASANFGLYRFNTTSGGFTDIPIAVDSGTGLASFVDGIAVDPVKGMRGTIAANSATAGSVGEVITNTGSASLTSATAAAATSASLTAGDWDVDCAVNFQPNSTAVSTTLMAQINNVVSLAGSSVNAGSLNIPIAAPAAFNTVIAPTQRENLSTTTTIYCVANSAYTGGGAAMTAFGSIRARRMR